MGETVSVPHYPPRVGSFRKRVILCSVSTPGVVLKHTYQTQALGAPDPSDPLAEAQPSAFGMAR